MKNLRDCVGKIYGKIISKEDADQLFRDVEALQARGLNPIQAEEQAVRDALAGATQNGENILRQIQAQVPNAAELATKFWDRQTVRPQGTIAPVEEAAPGMTPPPLPTEPPLLPTPPVPHQEIADTHNSGSVDEGGSTVNAVHGNLGGRQGNYSVSVFPEFSWQTPGRMITPEQVAEYEARLRAQGVDPSSPNLSIGTWYNKETNETYFDLAITTTNRERALALGFQYNQVAIFDLGNFEEIPTGGTGEVVAGLPLIAERLASIADRGVTPVSETTTAEAVPPGVPGRPPTAGAAPPVEPTGAGAVRPEVLGAHEEGAAGVPAGATPTSPDLVSPPLTDEQQDIVNSLPEDQRAAAQRAFQVDNRDLLADQERRQGKEVTKRPSKPVAPEKNKGLLNALSKYGVLDQDTSTVLERIAGDKSLPRWKRMAAELFNQLGLFDNLDIEVVNTPDAAWTGLYVPSRDGRGRILINLSQKMDFVGTLLHEVAHHGTKAKLEADESTLSPAEVQAKRDLEKIFDKIRARPEFEGLYGTTNLIEFVSELFADEDLRAKLDEIKPEARFRFMTQIRAAIGQLLGALGTSSRCAQAICWTKRSGK